MQATDRHPERNSRSLPKYKGNKKSVVDGDIYAIVKTIVTRSEERTAMRIAGIKDVLGPDLRNLMEKVDSVEDTQKMLLDQISGMRRMSSNVSRHPGKASMLKSLKDDVESCKHLKASVEDTFAFDLVNYVAGEILSDFFETVGSSDGSVDSASKFLAAVMFGHLSTFGKAVFQGGIGRAHGDYRYKFVRACIIAAQNQAARGSICAGLGIKML